MTGPVPRVSMDSLLERYEALYLDAYGVLLDHGGPLPGAVALVARLEDGAKPYLILTNDASRSPRTSAARFAALGLPIPEDRIITSGFLIAGYFETQGLRGARCMILGTEDSRDYVRDAGGIPVPAGEDADVLVLCDEMGFPYREHLGAAISLAYRRLDRGDPIRLVLANPDLVYPAAPGAFGFTAGALALVIEAALDLRYPGTAPRFARLGKPHPPMFEEAARRLPGLRAVMIGDQLGTDIRGAHDAGIDSALVGTGISRNPGADGIHAILPTWLLESIELSRE